ncbi:MAG: GntR family transcriptional regulator [Pseudomonadota bacterium]
MDEIRDFSFPEIFASLTTGRASSDKVLKTIIEGLLDGRFQPGEKVVARQLAEELDVSIVPVREAIHILAGEGAIDLTARKGARIRDMNADEVGAWWLIMGANAKLGVGLAAQRINHGNDNVLKMSGAMDLVRRHAGRLEAFQYLMVLLRYHMVVHDVAQMPQLNEASRRLGFFFWAFFFPKFIPVREYGTFYIRNHQRVTDAIVNGDAPGAEAAYQYHIEWTLALINGLRPDLDTPWVSAA